MREINLKTCAKALSGRSFGRKAIATMLAVMVALSGMPVLGITQSESVHAAGQPDKLAEVNAKLEVAKVKMDEAKVKLDEAKTDLDAKQGVYDAALENYDPEKAKYDAKKAAYDAAKEELSAAEENLKAAEDAKTEAEHAKKQAEEQLTNATSDLEEKEEAYKEAENELSAAKQSESEKLDQWKQEQTSAESDLRTAQEEYDKVGIDFLNEKAGDSLKDTVWLEWLKTNMAGKSFGSVNWNDMIGTDTFTDAFYSPYSYDNLLEAADLVTEGNMLRKSDNSSLSDLKISYKIMTEAIASNALSCHVTGHVLMNDSNYKSSAMYINSGSAGWENISWGSSDPFMGWYYDEKIHYLADQNGEKQANVTESMVNQIISEATSNGHDFLAYTKRFSKGSTVSEVVKKMNEKRTGSTYSTGHYTNLINSSHRSTGLSVNSKDSIYRGICHVQDFNQKDMSDAVTPEEFKAELKNYAKTKVDALTEAKNMAEELRSEPDYYKEAVANTKSKQDSVDAAKAAKDDAETARVGAENALEEAEATLTKAAKDYDDASQAYDKAETDLAGAKEEFEHAEEALAPLKTALDDAKVALDDSKVSFNTCKDAYDDAKKDYGTLEKEKDDIEYDIKAKNVKVVTINVKQITAKTVNNAVAKKGGSNKYVTTFILGKKVTKIGAKAFSGYKKVKTIIVKTRKLKKATIKNSLKASYVNTVKVKVGTNKVNKKFVKKYKKIFTKKIVGRKVNVK